MGCEGGVCRAGATSVLCARFLLFVVECIFSLSLRSDDYWLILRNYLYLWGLLFWFCTNSQQRLLAQMVQNRIYPDFTAHHRFIFYCLSSNRILTGSFSLLDHHQRVFTRRPLLLSCVLGHPQGHFSPQYLLSVMLTTSRCSWTIK